MSTWVSIPNTPPPSAWTPIRNTRRRPSRTPTSTKCSAASKTSAASKPPDSPTHSRSAATAVGALPPKARSIRKANSRSPSCALSAMATSRRWASLCAPAAISHRSDTSHDANRSSWSTRRWRARSGPAKTPIGKIMRVNGDRRVVGVVGDVRHLALEEGAGMEMYLPIRQVRDWSSVDLVVRTTLRSRRTRSGAARRAQADSAQSPGQRFPHHAATRR